MTLSPSERSTSVTIDQEGGRRRQPLGEAYFLLLAVSAWVGASLAPVAAMSRSALLLGVMTGFIGLMIRSPFILAAAVLVATSHQGARAEMAYIPLEVGSIADQAKVVGDPEPRGLGSVVELKLASGDRVEAVGYGSVGFDLQRLAVGDRLFVQGSNRPVGERPWLRARHITGRLQVESVQFLEGPGLAHQIPERARDLIGNGTSTMSERERGLYLGLVVGDDRLQTPAQRIKFRAAGLSHLLAVSGQNVAFVLIAAKPFLFLLGYRSRFVAVIMLLVLFAVVTRAEPSVLRATATAMIAAWASFSGRERSGVQMLALAVVVLLCIDPFLVDSVGFQLSVMASFGIMTVGPVIQARLPGPDWLIEPLSITLSAQAGVSPLLLAYFGPVSIASIPANLLAGWAAAATMTLGLTLGVASGLGPDWLAVVLQGPSRALLWWIEVVADTAASVRAPRLGFVELGLVVALVAIGIGARSPVSRLFTAGLVVSALFWSVPTSPTHPVSCGSGIDWYPRIEGNQMAARSVMVFSPDARIDSVAACFDQGIRQADVVVSSSGDVSASAVIATAREMFSVEVILAPPQHRVVGGRRQLTPTTISAGGRALVLTPSANGRRLLISDDG